jgi:hypothetical protein
MGAKVKHYVGHEFQNVRKDDRKCVCETPHGTMRFPNTHNLTEVTCIGCMKQVERWARKAGDLNTSRWLEQRIMIKRIQRQLSRKKAFKGKTIILDSLDSVNAQV